MKYIVKYLDGEEAGIFDDSESLKSYMERNPKTPCIIETKHDDDKTFTIEVYARVELGIKEIWPDGGAPEDPTVDDVVEVVRKFGPAYSFIRDWSIRPTVSVNERVAISEP